MSRTVRFKGSPLTLAGRQIKTGIVAADFKVSSQDLKEARLSDHAAGGLTENDFIMAKIIDELGD